MPERRAEEVFGYWNGNPQASPVQGEVARESRRGCNIAFRIKLSIENLPKFERDNPSVTSFRPSRFARWVRSANLRFALASRLRRPQGDSSPCTGEPFVACFILMKLIKRMALFLNMRQMFCHFFNNVRTTMSMHCFSSSVSVRILSINPTSYSFRSYAPAAPIFLRISV